MRTLAMIFAILAAAASSAAAQEAVEQLVDTAEPSADSYRERPPVRKSHVVPVLEVVALNVGLNLGARAAGMDWAQTSPDTMRDNLDADTWVWDQDAFSTDQIAHPYGGAVLFSAARSNGHGFWTSSAYAFAGSLFWEVLMESEPPSLNDQVTTTIAGAFLGEALHRWSRAVLTGGGERPGFGRQAMAAVIDPLGRANGAALGDAWSKVSPPRVHAALAAGYSHQLGDGAQTPLHVELAVAHGLPSDEHFRPRRPFSHFDLRAQLDASTDQILGHVDLRGLLFGGVFGRPGARALWGLYGTYDYWTPEGARASAIGVGPGITAHQALGDHGFLQLTGVVSAVPWGAAGGNNEVEGPGRDYQHGPGAAGLVEMRLGDRRLGALRLAARAIEIDGRIVGDAREAVAQASAGAMLAPTEHQALAVDVVYAARHTHVSGAADSVFDQHAQLRVMYAVLSDRAFGN